MSAPLAAISVGVPRRGAADGVGADRRLAAPVHRHAKGAGGAGDAGERPRSGNFRGVPRRRAAGGVGADQRVAFPVDRHAQRGRGTRNARQCRFVDFGRAPAQRRRRLGRRGGHAGERHGAQVATTTIAARTAAERLGRGAADGPSARPPLTPVAGSRLRIGTEDCQTGWPTRDMQYACLRCAPMAGLSVVALLVYQMPNLYK